MNLIKVAIDRPIAVVSAVLMVVLFGLVALEQIPIQLAPDVNRPVISVTTIFPGAAPAEVEREIINRQEEQMAGLEGLNSITANAELGRASVTLEFDVGTNMDRALLLVSNRLDRVTGYPQEVDQPTLDTAGSEDNPIAWFIVRHAPGNERPIHEFGDFIEDVVKDRIERVPGVSRVNVYGGVEREVHVTIRPEVLARYRLTVSDVLGALRAANASLSAGDVNEGKRRYVVRTEGELTTDAAIRAVVLRSSIDEVTGQVSRVTVGDIAEVGTGYKEPSAAIRMLADPAIAFNAVRQTGANVIETMDGIRAAVDDLNVSAMPGQGLTLTQVYDETVYIDSAIELVQQNIWIGGALAAFILILFLRSPRATLVISIAIPVSVIGAFVAMAALGRSINVISLAGLAFAVGMVVDAAIVVLENIFRLREEGRSAREAAYHGARQVWGAVLVSALTTVMVFIPILTLELEVGQLFRDIAVAISVAVLLSLIVSVTVIPALSQKLFAGAGDGRKLKRMSVPGVDHLARAFTNGVVGFVDVVTRGRIVALGVVIVVTTLAVFFSARFLPKLEYLPEGNRNLVFGVVLPPPGYNLETMQGIAENLESATRPMWASETGPEAAPDEPPKIERFFFVATRATTFVGATAIDGARAGELVPLLRQPVFSEPGTFGFISQPSIFGRGIGAGRKIELDISGDDINTILGFAGRAFGVIAGEFPREQGNQFRPLPGLELGAPEVRVFPDPVRLADNGLNARELGETVDVFNDGLRVTEVTSGAKRIDLTLLGEGRGVTETQGINNLPVVTRNGDIVPLSSVADVVLTAGPTEVRHRERRRTVTLEIRPAPGIPLESAISVLREKVMTPLAEDAAAAGVRLTLSGTANELQKTWEAMIVQLLLALVIVYLVMAVLFESFVYPLVIMLSVPVAAAGGIGGIALLNTQEGVFQPLDMLTMLGFVILVGIVVNNAILLVHQTLQHMREDGMDPTDAISTATRNRIRPIFMSTLTSVFGMLPLVLVPGAGSELYRGLGSVVVGGLSLSAVLTLLMVPPMLRVLLRKESGTPAHAPVAPLPAAS